MAKCARVLQGVAVEVVELIDGFSIEESFHHDVAMQFVTVPDEVVVGSTIDANGNWTAPPVAVAPVNPDPVINYPTVDAITFQWLFSSDEADAIEAARKTSTSLDRFWTLVTDPRTLTVDLALASIQKSVVSSLQAAKDAGADIDVKERTAQVLSGTQI